MRHVSLWKRITIYRAATEGEQRRIRAVCGVLLCAALLFVLSACGSVAGYGGESADPSPQGAVQVLSAGPQDSEPADNPIDRAFARIADERENELKDNAIFAYLYAWARGNLTPRGILPKLRVQDFDGDGADELAVVLYVGSGTGIAVTELHIVEIGDGMGDIAVTGEKVSRLLFHRLSADYDPASETVAVTLDGRTIDVDASQVDKERTKAFLGFDLTDIVYFDADDEGLSVHISVGLTGFDWVTPFWYTEFFADVLYDGSNISLGDCRLEDEDME